MFFFPNLTSSSSKESGDDERWPTISWLTSNTPTDFQSTVSTASITPLSHSSPSDEVASYKSSARSNLTCAPKDISNSTSTSDALFLSESESSWSSGESMPWSSKDTSPITLTSSPESTPVVKSIITSSGKDSFLSQSKSPGSYEDEVLPLSSFRNWATPEEVQELQLVCREVLWKFQQKEREIRETLHRSERRRRQLEVHVKKLREKARLVKKSHLIIENLKRRLREQIAIVQSHSWCTLSHSQPDLIDAPPAQLSALAISPTHKITKSVCHTTASQEVGRINDIRVSTLVSRTEYEALEFSFTELYEMFRRQSFQLRESVGRLEVERTFHSLLKCNFDRRNQELVNSVTQWERRRSQWEEERIRLESDLRLWKERALMYEKTIHNMQSEHRLRLEDAKKIPHPSEYVDSSVNLTSPSKMSDQDDLDEVRIFEQKKWQSKIQHLQGIQQLLEKQLNSNQESVKEILAHKDQELQELTSRCKRIESELILVSTEKSNQSLQLQQAEHEWGIQSGKLQAENDGLRQEVRIQHQTLYRFQANEQNAERLRAQIATQVSKNQELAEMVDHLSKCRAVSESENERLAEILSQERETTQCMFETIHQNYETKYQVLMKQLKHVLKHFPYSSRKRTTSKSMKSSSDKNLSELKDSDVSSKLTLSKERKIEDDTIDAVTLLQESTLALKELGLSVRRT